MILFRSRLIVALLLLGAMTARSQTVNWGSATESGIVDSHGDPLDEDFVFELGAFGAGFIPNAMNFGDWAANWTIFDTAAYSYSSETGAYFTGTRDAQTVGSYSSVFEGIDAYLWIRNGDQSENFLATSNTTLGAADWVFPTLDPGCCPNGDVTTWSVSNLGSGVPIWGSQRDEHGGGEFTAPGPFDLQTHAIPEPSGLLLLMMGCGFLVIRRRRNS